MPMALTGSHKTDINSVLTLLQGLRAVLSPADKDQQDVARILYDCEKRIVVHLQEARNR